MVGERWVSVRGVGQVSEGSDKDDVNPRGCGWHGDCCGRLAMARPLRYVEPGQVVEVTTRTIQSRFLLRPSVELNAALLAVLGRALAHHKVALHGFAVLSNPGLRWVEVTGGG